MQKNVERFVERYKTEHSKKQKVFAVFFMLSVLVVTGVFWRLKINGIALAGDAFCGQNEHVHTEKCMERVLICEEEEREGHQHSDKCYELQKNLKCQETEHRHGKECYKTEEILICTLEESAEHSHSREKGCYETKTILNCSLTEHTHNDGCCEENRILICEMAEEKGHVHTDVCYEERLTCQEKEHTHTVMCYSDKSADLETIADWEATLPEKLSEEWSNNLVAAAESQLGYTESVRNYILAEDGETKKGYSRYGAWYGNAYGDWCAMFVSFCLNYAGIPEEAIPYEAGCHAWTVELTELGLYEKPDQYIPVAGDIIFFDFKGTEKSDHVGIVTEIEQKENEQIVVHTIEGNSSERVEERTYNLPDDAIIGYGNLTKAKEKYDKFINPVEDVKNMDIALYALDGGEVLVGDAGTFKNAFVKGNELKTVKLNADVSVAGTINLTGISEIGLDLNGHKLTVTGNASLFNVPEGSSLTITDSQAKAETKTNQSGTSYGNVGTYAENGNLTYYVTETKVTDAAAGATQETLVKHDVQLSGRISAGGATVVNVTGGTVNLQSGMLYNGTNRAFHMTGGTLNLNGGYVFGFKKTGTANDSDTNFGGAILATGGITNVTGTVLAANEALNGGALYVKENAVVNVNGGIISGNRSTRSSTGWDYHKEQAAYRCGGGGIFVNGNAKLLLESGYITNNFVVDKGYFDGGGGVLYAGNSVFTINGGYITGNEAAGGGGVRSDWNKKTEFIMNGGFISGNHASAAEGGGISISQPGVGYIYGGYITNNITDTPGHWGGGGLFCSDGAYVYIQQANITENTAGGFGGGVAGCATGRVYICVKKGAAIYSNTAAGTNMSGPESAKPEDREYAFNSPVFKENGYQDYFCALNSIVEGTMLGGGSANWSGSVDGVAVKNVLADATLEAAYVMGLTANPEDKDIKLAQEAATVFFNGNSSHTHGGGILCNGYLIIGDKNPVAVGSRFTLSGTKKLRENGRDQSLEGHEFKFSVKDENGSIVSIGTSDKDGNIHFDRLLSFSEELCKTKITENGQRAVFVYYLTEDARQSELDIATDSTQYKISVTIQREDSTLPMEDIHGNTIKKVYYKIEGVNVEKSIDKGDTWNNVAYTWTPSRDEQHAGELKITNETTYINEKKQTTSLTVNKKWVGADTLPESITVDLLRDGAVIETVILNAGNGWSYTWEKLAVGHEYTVYEHPVPGYDTTYINGDNNDTETVSGWVLADRIEVGKKYLIVASDNTALTGNPTNGGAYDFGAENFTRVTVADGMIAVSDVTENMQWEAVTINGKICIKNAPSNGKHYLSYQNTDTVKAANTGYASQIVTDCNNGLRLYKQGSTTDIKYVTKQNGQNNPLKATSESANAVKLYTLAGDGSSSEDVITITNTKVSELYDLEITKVSDLDESKTLEGAEFRLLKDGTALTFSFDEENDYYVYDADGTITDMVTGANGQLHITGLPEGSYILKETKAPDGYEIADERTITLDGEEGTTVEITVKDKEIQYHLPETGGIGIYPYILIGLLLTAVSMIKIIKKKRR